MVERPLDTAEWDKQELKLRLEQVDGPDQVNRLYKKDGAWLNESVGRRLGHVRLRRLLQGHDEALSD